MAQVKVKFKRGEFKNRGEAVNGMIYFATDTKELWMANASGWTKYGDGDERVKDVAYSNGEVTVSYENGKTSTTFNSLATVTDTTVDNQFVTGISATNGVVSATRSGITSSQVTRTATSKVPGTDVEAALGNLADAIQTGGPGSVVTLEKQGTPETGYAATYVIKLGGNAVGGGVDGKINIPLDQFLKSVTYVSEAPANPEGNSAYVTFPALRFEWELDIDDLTAGDQVVTYVSIAELGATGTLTFDNTNATWTSTNGLLTTQAFKAEIDKMDGSIASSNGTNVNVTVTQTNGKVTAVSVSDSSINATDLSTAISNLGSDSATPGSVVTGVGVNNGALEVTESALAAVAFSGSADDVAYTNASLSGVDDVDGALDAIVDKIDDAADASKTTLSTVAASAETVADGTTFIKVVETSPAAADGHVNYEVSTKGIKDYIKAQIEDLDTPAGGVTSTGGSKVTINAVETDGVISALTVTESDIASAQGLANEITRAQTAEGELATVIGATGAEGARAWTPTTNYGGNSASAQVNMQAIDTLVKANTDALTWIEP